MKNKVNQLLVAIIALLVIALAVLGLQLLDSKDSTESNQDYSGTSYESLVAVGSGNLGGSGNTRDKLGTIHWYFQVALPEG